MIDAKELCNILIIDALEKAIEYYGLEGTLEAIDRVYPKDSKIHLLMKKSFFKNFLKK